MPIEEKICKFMDKYFFAPCGYGFGDKDIKDFIPFEWCEEHCAEHLTGDWECWRKLFEGWEE